MIDLEIMYNEIVKEAQGWRRWIHSHPELSFEEYETSKFVQSKLNEFGIPYENHWAKTGVVAKLEVPNPKKRLGFRCELDALPINELNNFEYRSIYPGKMHACGHDGHTSALLGSAKILSELYKKNQLKNSIYFIFQPAEENEGGAKKIIEEGFHKKFELDAVFSIHNWPDLQEGIFGIKSGPIMAAYDSFDIEIKAKGSHAAMPHQGTDVIYISTLLIQNIYSFINRMNPVKEKVISFTSIHSGSTYNVIPDQVNLKGTIRTLHEDTRSQIIDFIEKLLSSWKFIYSYDYKFKLNEGYPATINTKKEVEIIKELIKKKFGETKIIDIEFPSMGSEDFSYFLKYYPGVYIWIGSGKHNVLTPSESAMCLHSPYYDFNDNVLKDMIKFWVECALNYI